MFEFTISAHLRGGWSTIGLTMQEIRVKCGRDRGGIRLKANRLYICEYGAFTNKIPLLI